jgi:predicted anti-sigma-YlaC factor YlaD
MSRLNGLLQVLTLRCEAASELMSRELDETLPRLSRAALSCHLLACRSCRRFRGQMRVIRAAVRRGRRLPAGTDESEGLSPEARLRITRAIREASGEQADAESPPD